MGKEDMYRHSRMIFKADDLMDQYIDMLNAAGVDYDERADVTEQLLITILTDRCYEPEPRCKYLN